MLHAAACPLTAIASLCWWCREDVLELEKNPLDFMRDLYPDGLVTAEGFKKLDVQVPRRAAPCRAPRRLAASETPALGNAPAAHAPPRATGGPRVHAHAADYPALASGGGSLETERLVRSGT